MKIETNKSGMAIILTLQDVAEFYVSYCALIAQVGKMPLHLTMAAMLSETTHSEEAWKKLNNSHTLFAAVTKEMTKHDLTGEIAQMYLERMLARTQTNQPQPNDGTET